MGALALVQVGFAGCEFGGVVGVGAGAGRAETCEYGLVVLFPCTEQDPIRWPNGWGWGVGGARPGWGWARLMGSCSVWIVDKRGTSSRESRAELLPRQTVPW